MGKKVFTQKADGSFLTPEFRVSFPYVLKPYPESGKYSVTMIFDPDVDFSALEDAINAKVKEVYPKGAPKNLMLPILDGNDSDSGRAELVDKIYVNGKCGKYRPGLVDKAGADITDESEFYPGCWARAVVTLYHWAYLGKCGISVNVRNIQKLRDDEPLINRPSADADFGGCGVDEAVEDL